MKEPKVTDRKQAVRDSLLIANAGCMLAFVLLAGLPFAVIGGFFVCWGLSTMRDQARLHEMAITVPATIVSSEVRQSTTDSLSKLVWADIEFKYVFDGKKRTSNRVWPVEESGSDVEMRAIVDHYSPGTQVTAFVDLADPDRAFLEKRWSQVPYVAVNIGCLPFVFVTALGILSAGWKRPGIALLSGLGVGSVAILLLALTGGHYLQHVPPSEYRWWTWLVLVGSGSMTLGLSAAVIKARQLNRLYRAAIEAS